VPLHLPKNFKNSQIFGRVVYDYTHRHLTIASDKLNAISGIADDFKRYFGDSRSLAGLWEHYLVGGLVWQKPLETALPRPVPEDPSVRAPSWSWASVNGQVYAGRYFEPRAAFHCEIIDCQVDLQDQNAPFRETIDGYLKLSARAKPVLWCPDDRKVYQQNLNGELVRVASGYLDAEERFIDAEEMNSVLALPLILRDMNHPFGVIKGRTFEQLLMGVLVMADESGEWYRRVGYFDCAFEDESEEAFAEGEQQEFTIR
jgi:hypothetical protein